MVHNGGQLALMAGLGVDVAVKVPATEQGLLVARRLAEAGCAITPDRGVQPGPGAAGRGFRGRLCRSLPGPHERPGPRGRPSPRASGAVLTMLDILQNTQSATRLLVASIRSAAEVVKLASWGLDTLTFSAQVAAELLADENTEQAAADFQKAANPDK